ncbi:MAG: hypothetical protein N2050_02050 [Flavobacteriales bacterium]|nr:hypothetical protein [Flavobacteriales bacterium]
MRIKFILGTGGRWLSRPRRGRIEAPPWQGLQGRGAFYAFFPCNNGFCTTGPSIRRTSCGYSGTGWRYAALRAATQGPPFDMACCASLLRNRPSIQLAVQAYSGTGGG